MITVPEGMSFDGMGRYLGEEQKLISSVSRKGSKPFAVIPGTIREKYDTDRDWAYDAAREGERPQPFRVAEMDLHDELTKQQYVTTTDPDSIMMATQTVRLVGPNMIEPATVNPDFTRIKGKIFTPTPKSIMAKGSVEIYGDNETFRANGDMVNIPDMPGNPWQQKFPANASMQTPDGLIYTQPSGTRPGWDERQEVHEEYAEEGDRAAAMDGCDCRVSDDMSLEQLDIIASVAASVISAGAAGYGIYSKIAADKREKKAIAEQNKQAALQTAAMYNQAFSNELVASLTPQQVAAIKSGQGQTVAPFADSVDWTKIALFGGGAVVLVAFTYLLVKE